MAKARRSRVIWTRPALDGLLDIVRFIRRDSPAAARRFAAAVKAKTGRLQSFPDSGRLVPEFPGSGLREIVFGNCRIVYRHLPNTASVEILNVRHGARLMEEP